jgi:Phosphatidylserine/phosphatidylglycerophosphate/cardiolipin synthases and related enzymes
MKRFLTLIFLLSCVKEELEVSGDIQVYFTRQDNVLSVLLSLINSSKKTLSIAMFEMDHPDIVRAIVEAKNRGVKVEMVMDERMKEKWAYGRLKREGIRVVFDDREPFMHNKFVIIDSQIVITGSANFKESCIYRNDNNVVIINSRALALNYLREFYEMFEDKKFGALSPRNTDCCFNLGNYRIEAYFAPEDDVVSRINELIGLSRKEIKFAAFSFTDDKLANAIIYASKRGVKVRGVIESKGTKNRGSEYNNFLRNGIEVLPDGNPYNMHSKYIIIDDSVVITGSYNFSRNAKEFNDENVLIIFSKEVARKYSKNFDRIYDEAKRLNPL